MHTPLYLSRLLLVDPFSGASKLRHSLVHQALFALSFQAIISLIDDKILQYRIFCFYGGGLKTGEPEKNKEGGRTNKSTKVHGRKHLLSRTFFFS